MVPGAARWSMCVLLAGLTCFDSMGAEAQDSGERTVVFVTPDERAVSATASVLDAVRAELHDVPVRLVEETAPEIRGDLRSRIDLAVELARRHDAVGAFWLDLDRDGDVLVYLFEPEGVRVLVRRVRWEGSPDAGVEEVAVITRSTTSALIEGAEIGMEPIEDPYPVSRAVSPPPVRGRPAGSAARVEEDVAREAPLRLAVEYVGTAFARQVPWQSGIRTWIGWSPVDRLRIGIAYDILPTVDVWSDQAVVQLSRHPFELAAGWETPVRGLTLAGELGGVVDPVTRKTGTTASGLEPTRDRSRFTWGFVARARVLWPVATRIGFLSGVGLAVFPSPSKYLVEEPERETLVSPRILRLHLDAGLVLDLW